MAAEQGALAYEEPSITLILILTGFILALNAVDALLNSLIFCGLIGQVFIGIAFGTPGLQWLSIDLQDVVTQLGYLGLLLIVYEGGLSTNISILKSNLGLSLCIAITGIGLPIALSYVLPSLLPISSLQAFAAGAALCSTSLGTTFTILQTSGLSKSRLGVVLAGAAMMDDVVGLILVQIISSLGQSSEFSAVTLVRPLCVSIAYAVITPLLCVYVASPTTRLIRSMLQSRPVWKAWLLQRSCIFWLHTAVLVAFTATSGFAGTSNLFGAYLAGACISWWDDTFAAAPVKKENITQPKTQSPEVTARSSQQEQAEPLGSKANASAQEMQSSSSNAARKDSEHEESHEEPQKEPSRANAQPKDEKESMTGSKIFDQYYAAPVERLLKPFFFASIGFSIPITRMFSGSVVWRGIVYSILMILAKMICGLWLVRFQLQLPSISLNKLLSKLSDLGGVLFKHKSQESRSRTGDSTRQSRGNAPERSAAAPQVTRPAGQTIPKQKMISKPASLYPSAILGMAMVARGEIGFLVSAVAQSSGLYDIDGDSQGSSLFLVVTWAILLCTIVGPVITGVLVKRVWRMQKQERSRHTGREDPLGIWGAS